MATLPLYAALAAFASCAAVPYPLWDDYGHLVYILNGWTDWASNPLAVDGRPICSILICESFALAGKLTNLHWLRALALASTLLFTHLLTRHMRRAGAGNARAFAVAAVVVLCPAFGEYVGWTMCWPYPLVALAVVWLGSRLCEDGGWAGRIAARSVLACVGLQAVMLVYQPLAGIYPLASLGLLAKGRLRPALLALLHLAASFAIYRFATFPALGILDERWASTQRSAFSPDLAGHLRYVATDFLPFVASGWASLLLPKSGWMVLGVAVLALAAVGCVTTARSASGGDIKRTIAALALMGAAFALSSPQVFLFDDIWAYRTHWPMSVLMWLAALAGLEHIVGNRWKSAALYATAASLTLATTWCVGLGIAAPAMREYSYLHDALTNLRESGATKAVVMLPPGPDCEAQAPVNSRSCYALATLPLQRHFAVLAVAQDIWGNPGWEPRLIFDDAASGEDLATLPVVDLTKPPYMR